MKPHDVLAALPQFVSAGSPRALFNVLSNHQVTERLEAEGLVLQSGHAVVALEGANLEKYLNTMLLQAEQLKVLRTE